MRRPCLECGVPTEGSRCPTHRRARHNATYGPHHRRARATLREHLPGFCGYGCGRLLMPEGDWVAAHVRDGDPTAGWIASCRRCNERAKVHP